MDIQQKENYTLCIPNGDHFSIEELVQNMGQIDLNQHLILDLELIPLELVQILKFLQFARTKREHHTSFVIVLKGLDIDDIPDEINVAPTLQEALDILEMDAIERDLMDL